MPARETTEGVLTRLLVPGIPGTVIIPPV